MTFPRNRMSTPIAMTLAFVLMLGTFAPPVVAKKQEEKKKELSEADLRQAERNLQRAQAQAKVLGRDLGRTRARLQELRGEIAGIKGELSIAKVEYARALEDLEATEDNQETARFEYESIQETMDARMRSAYIAGPSGTLEIMLGADTLGDMSERTAFLEALQAQDANSARTVKAIGHDLQGLKKKQKELAKGAEDLLAHIEEQQGALEERVAEESSTAAELEKDARAAHALEQKWGKRVEVVEEKLRDVVVTGNGPLFACPVPDYTWWSNDFGAPRYGGGYHEHQGNDIGGKYGTEIVAPFDGIATGSSNSLGGITVNVSGKDGYVYNAHLSRIGKTGRVEAGEVIGYVGDSGDAQGTSPHDHFEWHPGGGDAVDPYPYLDEVC